MKTVSEMSVEEFAELLERKREALFNSALRKDTGARWRKNDTWGGVKRSMQRATGCRNKWGYTGEVK